MAVRPWDATRDPFEETEAAAQTIGSAECQVADLLRALARLRVERKALLQRGRELAVTALGFDQATVGNVDVETLLDGWLVGRGHMQAWRREDAERRG